MNWWHYKCMILHLFRDINLSQLTHRSLILSHGPFQPSANAPEFTLFPHLALTLRSSYGLTFYVTTKLYTSSLLSPDLTFHLICIILPSVSEEELFLCVWIKSPSTLVSSLHSSPWRLVPYMIYFSVY